MSRADVIAALLHLAALEAAEHIGKTGGLPDTPAERALFERYMRANAWALGSYKQGYYDTALVRMLYGVWRDRAGLQEAELAALRARVAELEAKYEP